MLIIPHHQLSCDVLDAVLEEYASRDGTDYGAVECSLAQKVSQLKAMLTSGEIVVVFDQSSETCDVLDAQQAKQLKYMMKNDDLQAC